MRVEINCEFYFSLFGLSALILLSFRNLRRGAAQTPLLLPMQDRVSGESGSGLFVCEDSEIPVELKDGGGDARRDRTPESFFENLRFGLPGYEEEDFFCREDTPDPHGIGLLRDLLF